MVKDRYIWRRVALMSQEVWSDKSRIDSRRGPSASGGDVVSHWGLGTALTPHVLCPNLKNTNTEIQNYTNTQIHRDKTQAQRLKLHPGGDVVSQWGTGTGRTSHVLCTASIYNTLLYTLHLASGHKTTIHCTVSTWRYIATAGAEAWQYNVLKTRTKTQCSREIRRAASPKTTLPLSQGQISDHGPALIVHGK